MANNLRIVGIGYTSVTSALARLTVTAADAEPSITFELANTVGDCWAGTGVFPSLLREALGSATNGAETGRQSAGRLRRITAPNFTNRVQSCGFVNSRIAAHLPGFG